MGDPVPIAGTLRHLAAGWGMENPLESARIVAGWGEIVGPEIARNCRPTSFKGGVLRVRAESAAWASEFRFLAPAVTARINAHLGADVVKQIKPWVGPQLKENRSRSGAPAAGPKHPAPEAPPEVLAEAGRLAEEVGDEALAEALRRALVAARIRQEAGTEVVQLKSIPSAPPARSRGKFGPTKHQ